MRDELESCEAKRDLLEVLLVEDSPYDQWLIRRLLKQYGFRVECVDTLAAATMHLRQERCDVVLLDLGLKDSQGLSTLEQLHKWVPEVPVVVLTSSSNEASGLRAVQLGAEDYLIKGLVSGPALVRGLRYVVERNRRYQLQGALRSLQAKLELAREIQGHLMCPPVNLPHFEAWASVTPAADLSGDFADALPLPDGHLAVALGDVTGHGFGSAILMATARAYLRTLLLEGCQVAPARVLQRMNVLLSHDVGAERFVAMSLAVLSPSGEMTFASAGQPAAYLLHADGQVQELSTFGNLPLGIEPGARYEELGPIALRSGDVLAMTTDGVLEAASPSGQLFEAERLLDALRQAAGRSSQAVVEHLQQQLDAHCATLPQRDDQSLLVVRVL